jgi:hypothetical protein
MLFAELKELMLFKESIGICVNRFLLRIISRILLYLSNVSTAKQAIELPDAFKDGALSEKYSELIFAKSILSKQTTFSVK